jgi:predicted ATPase
LDWSYNLLSDGERIVLRRIASFVGYFTLEGAQHVAGELEAQRAAPLALSKAERGAAHPGPSGNILPASERSFGRSGKNQSAIGSVVASTDSSQLGNIRAALEWSFGPNGDNEIATRLAAASLCSAGRAQT